MPNPKDQLIVALDGTPDEVGAWADALCGVVTWVKVGMTLHYVLGARIIDDLHAHGYKVFLDLKLHDIPHQVEGAAFALAALGVEMMTVHACGGLDMMAAALRGANRGAEQAGKPAPKILAVTVLTSMDAAALRQIGVADDPQTQVERLVRLSAQACVGGIVCSPLEAPLARSILGAGATIVTPGVRPAGSATGDQSRIATPARALELGATHLVVGRPITQSANPAAAAQAILQELATQEQVSCQEGD
ncbi:MAG: orotidine-5'-phosphate decarboxylase [Coriobacteriia bacterium]|nr:orotidine-5'-phosphate decarboxylase [Coriobacteriia bacterium]